MVHNHSRRIGVLTSGGDAPGMNAAVRAVARSAMDKGMEVFAIYEGYEGLVVGGDRIHKLAWGDVGGIIHRGGTIIGTARSASFRTREGRLQAAQHLIERGIDRLVVIGGDGSLTGANLFRQEWPELLAELVQTGRIPETAAQTHTHLAIVGMVGSIDNDMAGTDMTIGADTALHRITEAIDAISSTAASHQRTFVVEVMGRNCGYLALMGAIASGADWVLIPENPPPEDDWERHMCEVMRAGREAGRRDSIVIVAEGAQDRNGNPITGEDVRRVLEQQLNEDVRVTILGHMQRGGSPSAFDRTMSTLLGHAAVEEIADADPERETMVIGMRNNRITRVPLMQAVEQTHAITKAIAEHDYNQAMNLRSGSFRDAYQIFRTLIRTLPHPPPPGKKRLRLAVMNAGAPAPGMNTAVRAAVRLGLDQGHIMLGIRNGFSGFAEGEVEELNWMSVSGWATIGGSELGTNRKVPTSRDLYAIARTIEQNRIEGLLIIGGWTAYQGGSNLYEERKIFSAFNIPIICLPATIDNNLPGSELSIGADTALNNIVEVVDKIKQSAASARRCFVVEVMGRDCGYLALMSGIAAGAERVYLPEEGVTLHDLQDDLAQLIQGFKRGKRLGLMIRNERVSSIYTTSFMGALFEEEGRELFDVREAILGHLQQGGDPSPFDRIQATRLAARCIDFLVEQASAGSVEGVFIGLKEGKVQRFSLADLSRMVEEDHQRPREQWWMSLRPIARVMSQPGPHTRKERQG